MYGPAFVNLFMIRYHSGSVLGAFWSRAEVAMFMNRVETIVDLLHVMLAVTAVICEPITFLFSGIILVIDPCKMC